MKQAVDGDACNSLSVDVNDMIAFCVLHTYMFCNSVQIIDELHSRF